MKIKISGNIIGIICTAEESELAFNALVDFGVDSYAIVSQSNDSGKTIHVFNMAALPFVDSNEYRIHPARVSHFLENFPEFFERCKTPATLFSDVHDYFDVATASVRDCILVQFA